jgi:hypothetical protein
MTVLKRCATVSSSASLNSSRMVAWILASVAKSILLVASSRMMIELLRSSALAIAISCRWPCEKLDPPDDTFVEREMVVLASISVEVETESIVPSRSTELGDDGREGSRECTREGPLDGPGVPVII